MTTESLRSGVSAIIAGLMLAGMLATNAGAALPRGPISSAAPQGIPTSGDALVAAALVRAKVGDCKGVLALLDPFVAATPAGRGADARFSAQLLRMPCLAAVGRGADMVGVEAELKRQSPDQPQVLAYQIFIDADAGRPNDAADELAAIADKRSPALALIPGELWRVVSQQLTVSHDGARRDRTALALAQADWQPRDRPDMAEGLAADGIGALLDRGDVEDARPLLDRLTRPVALWSMAIQHRYASLWSDIEARLGPEGGIAADRYARTTLATYAENPADDRAVRDAVRAFMVLGRFEDVESTASAVSVAPGMSEEQVDTVMGHAEALSISGDQAGALARLKPFEMLDLARTPSATTPLILTAEILDDSGRFEDELVLARTVLSEKAFAFSPFGLVWIQRSETCALAGLHRETEAKTAGDRLKASAPDNQAAAVEGLLCAGRDDEAAAIAIGALATAEGTDGIVDQFQPSDAIYGHPPSRTRPMWSRLLRRADVKSAFDRSARILAKALWPAAAPRAVPLLPGSVDPASTT